MIEANVETKVVRRLSLSGTNEENDVSGWNWG